MTLVLAMLAAGQSAMIEVPPNVAKQALIAEFLRLSGTQAKIDEGSAVDRLAFDDGTQAFQANTGPDGSYRGDLSTSPLGIVTAAYKKAYAPHRAEYTQAYAEHVNWEFTEAELREINGFLRRKVGQHYLEGVWRMQAYTGTNTEELDLRVAEQAKKLAKSDLAAKGFKSPPSLDLTFEKMRAAEGLPQ